MLTTLFFQKAAEAERPDEKLIAAVLMRILELFQKNKKNCKNSEPLPFLICLYSEGLKNRTIKKEEMTMRNNVEERKATGNEDMKVDKKTAAMIDEFLPHARDFSHE